MGLLDYLPVWVLLVPILLLVASVVSEEVACMIMRFWKRCIYFSILYIIRFLTWLVVGLHRAWAWLQYLHASWLAVSVSSSEGNSHD